MLGSGHITSISYKSMRATQMSRTAGIFFAPAVGEKASPEFGHSRLITFCYCPVESKRCKIQAMTQSIQLKRITSTVPIAIMLVLVHLTAVADPSGSTSLGVGALPGNRGVLQTAIGYFTLHGGPNTEANTAIGAFALENHTTGDINTAVGGAALRFNTTGHANTAVGAGAGFSIQTGNQNTVIGQNAVGNVDMADSGSNNIAVGFEAGLNLGPGNDYNIDIGNQGVTGDSGTIRVGDSNQTKTFISGISGVAVSGVGVIVNASGQLGVAASSARFKSDIKPMDKASEAILGLKPVSFHYTKNIDSAGTSQFGLVAEEVEKVNPDLVLHDKEGRPYSVHYEAVNAMLLNEFLKEHKKVSEQQAVISKLQSTVAKQETNAARQQKQIEALTAGLQKVSVQLELEKRAPQTAVSDR